MHGSRWDVGSSARLRELALAALPPDLGASRARRSLHRDLYLDTPDGQLRRRGITCRFRITSDDRCFLGLEIAGAGTEPTVRHAARTRSADASIALGERNTVTRRLRALVDPARLTVRATLETERYTRVASRDLLRRPRIELHYDLVTVRGDSTSKSFQQICAHARRRGGSEGIARLAGVFERDWGLRPVQTGRLELAELLLRWMPAVGDGAGGSRPATTADEEIPGGDGEMLDPELSFLESQLRVLALAEDPGVPLLERARFLAIAAANLDEFFAVRIAALKAAPAWADGDPRLVPAPTSSFPAIVEAARALVARKCAIAGDVLLALSQYGRRVCTWDALDPEQQAWLREWYRDEIHPALTPLAMTLSAGHPFPRLPDRVLSIAVVLRDGRGTAPHLAQVEIPDQLPRFVHLDDAGGARTLVPVEDVIRANLGALYPGVQIEQAYLFRVTRRGDLALDEENVSDLLEAVDDATRRRGRTPVVRVEVERAMPFFLRDLLLDELVRESGDQASGLSADDVYEIEGLLDLRGLASLCDELPDASDRGGDTGVVPLRFPPFAPAVPVPAGMAFLDVVRTRELLVHHPFESFDETVIRFVREAAADPDVTAIKMTLYRIGERPALVDALRSAATGGKQVYALVELRARADEARNVKWVRALEKAGVHVVYGLTGLKTHAKMALVVRRENGGLRQYVHVGTGNYNPQSGRSYTDLSLFSAEPALAADVADLFNSLTGYSAPLDGSSRVALVAPMQLVGGLLQRIDAEAAHARAGRPAAIRIKVNGLSDPEIVRALGRAASDGVRVDLVVRGICTLRPAPASDAAGVRVVANAGRFLEHSRIYHFANGGAGEYYIGSADLRPRNLRRRVELLVPVRDPAARERLDELLEAYLNDAAGWELERSGRYVRRQGPGPGAQELLVGRTAAPPRSREAELMPSGITT